MKKKLIATLSIALVALMVIGGTLAYFTDEEYAKNVMTTGNIDIVQKEQERGENGLVDFESKKLVPYTGSVDADGMANDPEYPETVTVNGKECSMFRQEDNAVDKIVTVYNEEGSEAAYVRTLFAFEVYRNDEGEVVLPIYTNAIKDAKGIGMALLDGADNGYCVIEVDGVEYVVAAYDYNVILAGGEETVPSLKQVYLNANAGNEFAEKVGEEYDILVLSQAVQAEGFQESEGYVWAEANAAFEAAYGVIFDGEGKATAEQAAVIEGWFVEAAK